ncbi:unnamed protein product [Urochloa decumbens]|uniref:Phosphoribosyltransferase domain-containing protein n=1 Tax=Urochloa decumbens TaxID=240449 RepID=A0ABC8VRH4_9POAL
MVSAAAGIERVLWTEAEVAARVGEVAAELAADLRALPEPAVVVGVATGAFLFLADLVRRVDAPLAVDFVRVESYGGGTESSGKPRITADLKVDVAGKHVVVVEDIVDTGNTLSCLIAHLEKKGASSISVCTFLDKPARRKVNVQLVGDGKFYSGFEVRIPPPSNVILYGTTFFKILLPKCYIVASERCKLETYVAFLFLVTNTVLKSSPTLPFPTLQVLICFCSFSVPRLLCCWLWFGLCRALPQPTLCWSSQT